MNLNYLQIDRQRLAEVCARYHVTTLEVFGSFVRGDADAYSDMDILATFEPDAQIGLEFVSLQQELEAVMGRPVDLLSRSTVERSPNKYFRRFSLQHTEPVYERA